MRATTDLPRRRPRPGRGRTWLIVLAVVLFVLITSLRGIAGFYTDFLWFDSLGYSGVFTGVLGAKVALGAIFTGVFFLLLWLNLFVADRLAPRFRPPGPEEDVIERYRELVGERTGLVRLVVAAAFAVVAGAGVSGQWNEWILFTNAQDFGIEDPQFGADIGFYVFRLPFLSFLADWLFASVVVITIVTAVGHYLNGGIRIHGAAQRVTPQVKGHLSVLLGLLALIKAGDYWLERFELTLSTRGVVDGATYTDVNAQLPALHLLIVISVIAFFLFLINIRRRGWVLPVLAVGLWGLVAVVVGGIYPAIVQQFSVQPEESTREALYIERNIAATRAAMGLDEVEVNDFRYNEDLTASDLADNEATIRNVRLLDPNVVDDTYQRLQAIRTFYEFPDLDVDRYVIDGEITQVVLAARELDRGQLPQSSWEARHLAYTHGFGMAVAPANAVTSTGRPQFIVRGLPPQTPEGLELEQPAIYFGEDIGGYSIVDTGRQEINFVAEDGSTDTTRYDGEGGVGIGSYFRRFAFFLRFGDYNPLISNFIESDSRILYIRDVRERVEALAPFLHFDADPYPVILDGRIVYVIDGYSTTDMYPYAQRAETGRLPDGSGLDHSFRYVRNSVKAVVDAYHGSVDLYVIDDDPIVAAYRQAFPDLFTDGDDMPEELREHLRYPEDLFRAQTTMWGRYHISEPDEFYEQSDAWSVAQDPGTTSGTGASGQTTDAQGRIITTQQERIDPYYLLMRLPEEEQESFVILRPFVPFSEDDRRPELSAFMVAKSDPDEYGKLQTYVMPRGELPDGPAIVASNINSNEKIAREISLLDQEGSEVRFGNLQLVPIEQSLLYVRPLYVQATGGTQVPELRKVIVAYGGRVVMFDTLRQALVDLFGEAPETREAAPDPDRGEGEPPGEGESPGGDGEVAELLAQAAAAFDAAQEALDAGDLGTYQEQVEEARRLIERAQAQTQEPAAATSTTTTTTGTA